MGFNNQFVTGYQNFFNPAQEVDIANGQQESAALNCGGIVLVGILFPAAFTGTAVTFEVSNKIDGTYVPLYNSAGLVSYTIAQGRFYAIDPKDFYGVNFLKIKSGSAEGAARALICSLKGF
jgi:hypothetical protein